MLNEESLRKLADLEDQHESISVGGMAVDLGMYTKNCMHENCPRCLGTGRQQNGQICAHFLSCPCPKCTPYFL